MAVVARNNPLGVVPVATFLAAIATSGSRLQGIGIEVEVVFLLQGLIFLTVTAGEFFVTNKVEFASAEAGDAAGSATEIAGAT